jgi:hypothetical protein
VKERPNNGSIVQERCDAEYLLHDRNRRPARRRHTLENAANHVGDNAANHVGDNAAGHVGDAHGGCEEHATTTQNARADNVGNTDETKSGTLSQSLPVPVTLSHGILHARITTPDKT